MNEEWRPVVGYEGDYEVSSCGRVRSLDRLVQRPTSPFRARGRTLKPVLVRGYPLVTLRGGRRHLVHVLMLEAFVGPRPEGMYGCHWDDVKTNNVLSNLRWDTPAANSEDKRRHGNVYMSNKAGCPAGHALAEPNLVAAHVREGHRGCLSCCRARSINRYLIQTGRRGIDVQRYADRVYADLMNGGPGTVKSVTGGGMSLIP